MRLIIPELLKLNILDKNDKDFYKKILIQVINESKKNIDWARYIIPELLKLNILDKNDQEWVKEQLRQAIQKEKTENDKELLLEIIKNAKENINWAQILPILLGFIH